MDFLFYEIASYIRSMEKKKSKLSDSFVVGVVVLVFLIVGYQTALFIYRASVMKIVSNRDHPDTVYVYHSSENQVADIFMNELDSSMSVPKGTVPGYSDLPTPIAPAHRKSAQHSPLAESVRQSAPRPRVESFRFNPNRASSEEFRRLGFSEKQAQAIINYREKGGIFRRKEDFARSFVVSDSIYRRLAPYIDIPLLDLNLADSADFDALPGIGGWFAKKMVEYRTALGGYSYKEQLLDIYKFTEEKYQALEDLITVSPKYMTPYPLWTLPADSLRLHPYIKDYETARSIVLYRENSPKDSLSVSSLASVCILNADLAAKLSRCVILSPD